MNLVELRSSIRLDHEVPAATPTRDLATLLLTGGYSAAILGAELVAAYYNPLLALVLQGAIIVGLLAHAATRQRAAVRRLFLVLALVPLLRLVSMVLVTSLLPTVYLYALVALPVASALFMVARGEGLTWESLGLGRVAWKPEILMALCGLPLSLGGYWLLQPAPLLTGWGWSAFMVAACILILAATVEETLFRGLLQQAAYAVFGTSGIVYSSLVYAISFSSWQAVEYLGAALVLGLCFGWWAKRTGSLWGVIAAHSIINIGMFLVWPLLF